VTTFSFPLPSGTEAPGFSFEDTTPVIYFEGNVYRFVNVNVSSPFGVINFGVSTIVPDGQTATVEEISGAAAGRYHLKITEDSGSGLCAETSEQGPRFLRWTACSDRYYQVSLYRAIDSSA
jgi:hypothetical protein